MLDKSRIKKLENRLSRATPGPLSYVKWNGEYAIKSDAYPNKPTIATVKMKRDADLYLNALEDLKFLRDELRHHVTLVKFYKMFLDDLEAQGLIKNKDAIFRYLYSLKDLKKQDKELINGALILRGGFKHDKR